jgi:hypothetical protein
VIWHELPAALAFIVAAAAGAADPPATRAEILRQLRADKATQVRHHEPGIIELGLHKLENERIISRVLNPEEGFYPKVGHVTTGSSLSFGVGYRKPGLWDDRGVLSGFVWRSFTGYWMADARVAMPALAGGSASVEVYGQAYRFPREAFFGLGHDSLRERQAVFGVEGSTGGASVGFRPNRYFALGARAERLTPHLSPGEGRGRQIRELFTGSDVPGFEFQPGFNRYEISAELNFREPRQNPRRGGRYHVGYSHFDDRHSSRYDFSRLEIDLQQYVSILRERRVIALRALASASSTGSGRVVPFYMMRTLGGPDDLRGFRRYRFRDRNLVLFQVEYRWEVFTAMDAAIFVDAGQVAPRLEDLGLRRLETNYGLGVRFGSVNGVFLRVEGAFGSRDGRHFIMRFGHVF